ncbi:MAG TPA: hypothetical protein ENN60_02890 [archaeon]|nr:hypothetical protein [archaeon]
MRKTVLGLVFAFVFLSVVPAYANKHYIHFPGQPLYDNGAVVLTYDETNLLRAVTKDGSVGYYIPVYLSASCPTCTGKGIKLDSTNKDNDNDFFVGTITYTSSGDGYISSYTRVWSQQYGISYPGYCDGTNDYVHPDRRCVYESAKKIYTSCVNSISFPHTSGCIVLGGNEISSDSVRDESTQMKLSNSAGTTYFMYLDYRNYGESRRFESHYSATTKQPSWGLRTCKKTADCEVFGKEFVNELGGPSVGSFCVGDNQYLAVWPFVGEPIYLGGGLCSDLITGTFTDYARYASTQNSWLYETKGTLNTFMTKEGATLCVDGDKVYLKSLPTSFTKDAFASYQGARCKADTSKCGFGSTVKTSIDKWDFYCDTSSGVGRLQLVKSPDTDQTSCETDASGVWISSTTSPEVLGVFDYSRLNPDFGQTGQLDAFVYDGGCAGEFGTKDYLVCTSTSKVPASSEVCTYSSSCYQTCKNGCYISCEHEGAIDTACLARCKYDCEALCTTCTYTAGVCDGKTGDRTVSTTSDINFDCNFIIPTYKVTVNGKYIFTCRNSGTTYFWTAEPRVTSLGMALDCNADNSDTCQLKFDPSMTAGYGLANEDYTLVCDITLNGNTLSGLTGKEVPLSGTASISLSKPAMKAVVANLDGAQLTATCQLRGPRNKQDTVTYIFPTLPAETLTLNKDNWDTGLACTTSSQCLGACLGSPGLCFGSGITCASAESEWGENKQTVCEACGGFWYHGTAPDSYYLHFEPNKIVYDDEVKAGENINAGWPQGTCLGHKSLEKQVCDENSQDTTFPGPLSGWRCTHVSPTLGYAWLPYFTPAESSNSGIVVQNMDATYHIVLNAPVWPGLPPRMDEEYTPQGNLGRNFTFTYGLDFDSTGKLSCTIMADDPLRKFTLSFSDTGSVFDVSETRTGGRETLVEYCRDGRSTDTTCNVNVSCTWAPVLRVEKGSTYTGNSQTFSFDLIYNDQYLSCYDSKYCIGFCDVNPTLETNSYILEMPNPGTCKATSVKPSNKCEAGDYLTNLLKIGTDGIPLWDWNRPATPLDIVCDGNDRGSGDIKSSCRSVDDTCYLTCYDTALTLYAKLRLAGVIRATYPEQIDNLYLDFGGGTSNDWTQCNEWESYLTCRDCCEKPIASKCSYADYYTRWGSDHPLCGISFGSTICSSSCGAWPECDGVQVGRTDCTEWCQARSGLKDSFGMTFSQAGQTLETLDDCQAYDTCFILPFDPHCEMGRCTLTLATGSHPLIAGNQVILAGQSLTITPQDVVAIRTANDPQQQVWWKFCTADGGSLPLKFIPELAKITDNLATFKFKFGFRGLDGGSYTYPSGTTVIESKVTVQLNNPGGCDAGRPCVVDADCRNYLPEEGTDKDPFCSVSRHVCSDPDLEGVYFGTILSNDWAQISDLENAVWTGCTPNSCSYSTSACEGYFLGFEVRQDAIDALVTQPEDVITQFRIVYGGSSYSSVFTFSNPITTPGKYIAHVSGPERVTFLPATRNYFPSEGGMVYVELINDRGITLSSMFKLNVDGLGTCDTVLQSTYPTEGKITLSNTATSPPLGACYDNTDCKEWTNPNPAGGRQGQGSVIVCQQITQGSVALDGYTTTGTYRYAFGGICTNICGNGTCDYSLRETPSNCKDCCTDYGTGKSGELSWGWASTCYTKCGAQTACNERKLGEIVKGDTGDFMCGVVKSGTLKCGSISSLTSLTGVQLGPNHPGVLPNITKLTTSTSNHFIYEAWTDRMPEHTLTFTVDSYDWNEVKQVTGEIFDPLKRLTLTRRQDGYTQSVQSSGSTVINSLTYTFTPSTTYGPRWLNFTLQQGNRLPVNVSILLHTIYDTQLTAATEGGPIPCYYRGTTGVGLASPICNIQPIKLELTYLSEQLDQGFPNSKVTCSLGGFSVSSTLVGLNDRATLSGMSLMVGKLTPGRYNLVCQASGQYLKTANFTLPVDIYGRILDVTASVPFEVMPGNSYELPILGVYDEYGDRLPVYSYSWWLVSGASTLTGVSGIPAITLPYDTPSDAFFRLNLRQPFYQLFEKNFPVDVLMSNQISASVSPGIFYLPLSGTLRVEGGVSRHVPIKASLLFSNEGSRMDLNLSVLGSSLPDWLTINFTTQSLSFEGWDVKSVPVQIFAQEAVAGRQATVTFQLTRLEQGETQVIASANLRVVQTDEETYEFDVSPLVLELDLVDREVQGMVTIWNVGTVGDAYLINSDLRASHADVELDPRDSVDVTVSATKAGEYEFCVRSVRLLTKKPKCISILVIGKEVTPILLVEDQAYQILPQQTPTFTFNLTTANHSGNYIFEFDTNLTVKTYERALPAEKTAAIFVNFQTAVSGTHEVKVKAYPQDYPHKYKEANFKVTVTFPAPYEAQILVQQLEEGLALLSASDRTLLAQQQDAAMALMSQGRYDEAVVALRDIHAQLTRLNKIEAYMDMASQVQPYRFRTLLVVGVLLAFVGAFVFFR